MFLKRFRGCVLERRWSSTFSTSTGAERPARAGAKEVHALGTRGGQSSRSELPQSAPSTQSRLRHHHHHRQATPKAQISIDADPIGQHPRQQRICMHVIMRTGDRRKSTPDDPDKSQHPILPLCPANLHQHCPHMALVLVPRNFPISNSYC